MTFNQIKEEGGKIRKGSKAEMVVSRDVVNMPDIIQFESSQAYYATCFHELAHSTGHASRLARPAVMKPEGFGSTSYSQEELVAEMAASFLCATVNIDLHEERPVKMFDNGSYTDPVYTRVLTIMLAEEY